MGIIVDAVAAALRRLEQVDRPEVWISLRERDDLFAEAEAKEKEIEADGRHYPLAGYIFGVKDNIDVAGLPTTAAARSYSYEPEEDARAVALLRAQGAIVLGKTNLDQFATGLVGTRSPFGAVRCSVDPVRISGGSSSGSAVAVALGVVDFALGTDTAGSGRVPAALNGIVGVKPSVGLVSTMGVVPACRSLDCVTVFARTLEVAQRITHSIVGYDPRDAYSQTIVPIAAESTIIAVPLPEQLELLSPEWKAAFYQYCRKLELVGYTVQERDITPLLTAATMLYGPQFVAERYSAVGEFIQSHQELIGNDLDPTVASIILGGNTALAWELFREQAVLKSLISQGKQALVGTAALLTPTTTRHPKITEVRVDPIGVNTLMGTYTNFCNLGGFAALAVPAGTVGGLPFGVMFTGMPGSDDALIEIARKAQPETMHVFVVGAHRRGQVLNHELTMRQARFQETVRTAPHYQLYALDTRPIKPGLVRVSETINHGIEGEVWALDPAGFASFIASLPQPMAIGKIELHDGRKVPGFLCENLSLDGALDITEYGSWLTWLEKRGR